MPSTSFDTKLFVRRQAGGMFNVLDVSAHPGKVWYVDSTNTTEGKDASGFGVNPSAPFLTLEYCIANAMLAGDQVYLMPGHNEDSDVVLFDADVANIEIVGLGIGTLRPRFDFNNAASTISIGDNGVKIKNVNFLASAASVLIGINVETGVTNFTLEDCIFQAAETAGDEFIEMVNFVGGNDGSMIRYNAFITEMNAGTCTEAISTDAACDLLLIEDNVFIGNWSTAAIVGQAADTEVVIRRNQIKVADGQPGIELNAGTTGSISDNYIASTGLAVDLMIVAALCEWFENYGTNADGATAELIGVGRGETEADEIDVTGVGSEFYVDSVNGGAGNGGTSWGDALDTLNAAVDLCTLNVGDIIHVARNHEETVAGAAAIDLDIAGISIIGYGVGYSMPTLIFDTNTDTVEVNAANIRIHGIKFRGSVTDLAVALDVTGLADGLVVEDCWFMDDALGTEMLVAINVANAANDMIIQRNRFNISAGGDATDAILFAGDSHQTIIRDNVFIGDWASGVIDGSNAAQTDISILDNWMFNVDAASYAINMHAASTGMVVGNNVYGGAPTGQILARGMHQAGNTVTQTLGNQEQEELGIKVVRASSTVPQTAALNLFTVAGGRVEITAIVGQVDTNNFGAVANATSLDYSPTAGQTSIMCATLDLTGTTIGSLLSLSGVPSETLQKHGMKMAVPVILNPGTIDMDCGGSEANATQVQWTLYWKPIDAAATVVVA